MFLSIYTGILLHYSSDSARKEDTSLQMKKYETRKNIFHVCIFLVDIPGKLGMDGSHVWKAYQDGQLPEIRAYCETDVTNTYLLYLRWQLMQGGLQRDAYEAEINLVKETLRKNPAKHWQEFLAAWGGD